MTRIEALKKEYGGLLSKPWKLEVIELDFKGMGTKEDPIVVDSAGDFPDQIEIYESEKYLLIKGIIFTFTPPQSPNAKPSIIQKLFGLHFSSNVIFKDCVIEYLRLHSNKDIILKNCSIKTLIINECTNCSFENTKITEELVLFKSIDNKFIDCEIHELSMGWSKGKECPGRGNAFNNTQIEINALDEGKSYEYKEDIINIFGKGAFSHTDGPNSGDLGIGRKGTGTINDPIIIEHDDLVDINKDENMNAYGNRKHLLLRGIELNYFLLDNCMNIIIENMRCAVLDLNYCSNITISKSTPKKIIMRGCSDILIKNSMIRDIVFKKQDSKKNIIIENSTVKRMKKEDIFNLEINDSQISKIHSSTGYLFSKYKIAIASCITFVLYLSILIWSAAIPIFIYFSRAQLLVGVIFLFILFVFKVRKFYKTGEDDIYVLALLSLMLLILFLNPMVYGIIASDKGSLESNTFFIISEAIVFVLIIASLILTNKAQNHQKKMRGEST